MTPKEHPKELKEFLYNLNKKHDSVYKERELELKDCLINGFTYRQEPMLIPMDLLYGYC